MKYTCATPAACRYPDKLLLDKQAKKETGDKDLHSSVGRVGACCVCRREGGGGGGGGLLCGKGGGLAV